MSLLSGMNNMTTNQEAMEAALDMELFEDEIAMEADELIDTMVDGKDEIAELIEEDEMEDEINEELEEEDNSIASASEAAALTGDSFLNALNLDTNDPIKTKAGSLGPESSAATFAENFSFEAEDNNDPISTKPGSIGQQTSAANFEKNFFEELEDNNDPITTQNGSIGQKTSSPKDPVVESVSFFGDLLDQEIATEGIVSDIIEKRNKKKSEKRSAELSSFGIEPLDNDTITSLLDDNKFDDAIKMAEDYGKQLEIAKGKIPEDDPEADKKVKTLNKYIKTNASLLVKMQKDKKKFGYVKEGCETKKANEQAIADMRTIASKIEDPAMEAFFTDCIDLVVAFESEVDPEATVNGSIGQKDSKATSADNFSDGRLDTDDPIKTNDGSEGQKDSAATYEDNFSSGELDEDDPIKTENGSVGTKESTPKDPASESSTVIDDELDALMESLMEDFEDDEEDDDDECEGKKCGKKECYDDDDDDEEDD